MKYASIATVGIASALLAGAASADVTVEVSDFSAVGGEFVELFSSGALAGTLTGVGVDVVLTGSENFTWADDFTILVGSDGSTAPLLQAGGFSDFGALERISWSNGSSGDDGTTCIDAQDLATAVVPFSVSIGNGYASGGNGTWNGTFTLFGVTLGLDCDENGIADEEEIANGTAADCNENGVIDSCEIADGSAVDINADGILDECQETLEFSVPGGFGTIAEAIDAAPDGSIISLAPGVYNEIVNFGAKNLVLQGDADDPSSVVLDGTGLGISVVAITGGQDASTIIRGLTIANGELGSPLPGQPTSLAGGGIFVNNSTPIIEHCRFIDNVSGFGGGVYLRYSDARIRAVEFIGNRATTDGGALFVFDSAAEIRDVEMLENSSTNHGGAAKVVYGETILVDCDMLENQSFEGGGVYWFGGPGVPPLVIEGCSIRGNTAMREGGGIKTRSGYPGVTLSASVVCENAPNQIEGDYEDLGGNCLEALCVDSDADGTIDCFDACPDDPDKIDPGACGCGNPETDSDGDGVPDCVVGAIDSGLVWSSQQGGNGHLYSQVSFNTGVTWAEARAYAISVGANLVSFGNDAESIAVKAYLAGQDVSRGWIGLYQDVAAPDYAEPAGGWRWSDGTEYAYVDWLPGEPSNASIDGTTEDFGVLSAPNNQPPLGWNDKSGRLAWAMFEWSEDCDGNGIVDRIEILAGGDCNGNGELDACDVLSGGSEDVNRNFVPDECEDTLTFSVPSGFETIAEAIDAAPGGSVISLAAGIYNEAVDFGTKNLVLRGDASDPSSVVLDGTGLEMSVVSIVGDQNSSSSVIGLTIANGAIGSPLPGQPTSRIGGGLFIRNASPLIQDCIFESNTSGFGGAIYVLNGAAIIDHCDFVENSATTDGGAIFVFGSGGRISSCRFEANAAVNHGGGVKVVLGAFQIIDSEITGNSAYQGGGLYWFANSGTLPLRVTGCAITGNTASKAGGGIKARIGFPGVDLMDATVCDNHPDEIDGEYIDSGGNTLCICVADFTGDGVVSGADLGLLLGAWGACNPDTQCFADLTGDGVVTGADLGLLLGAWGVCVDP